MEVISNSAGVGGLLKIFRELVKDSKKVMFIGTTGFCTPFAELMSYGIRDLDIQAGFVPDVRYSEAKQLVKTSFGIQIGENTDYHADTVIVLGGVSMPKMGFEAGMIKETIENILENNAESLVIGVCFQSAFEKQCWISPIGFDYVIDADMNIDAKKID